jgi:predicted RNase H-like HicB family nuclease
LLPTTGPGTLPLSQRGEGSLVAEIPALHLAAYGAEASEALDRLKTMLTFHLESMIEEGKPLPLEVGE